MADRKPKVEEERGAREERREAYVRACQVHAAALRAADVRCRVARRLLGLYLNEYPCVTSSATFVDRIEASLRGLTSPHPTLTDRDTAYAIDLEWCRFAPAWPLASRYFASIADDKDLVLSFLDRVIVAYESEREVEAPRFEPLPAPRARKVA